jgi:hypothetical protein
MAKPEAAENRVVTKLGFADGIVCLPTFVLSIDALVEDVLPVSNAEKVFSTETNASTLDALRSVLSVLLTFGLNDGIDQIAVERLGIPVGGYGLGLLGLVSNGSLQSSFTVLIA